MSQLGHSRRFCDVRIVRVAGNFGHTGWMAVAEAIADLFLPDVFVARLIGTFNTATWYSLGGVLAIGLFSISLASASIGG